MTYREEIQLMIQQLEQLNDKAAKLRDYASLEDKKYFNKVREFLPNAWEPLQKLDDSLDDDWAAMIIE